MRIRATAALLVAAAPLACAVPAGAEPPGGVLVARYADALGTANGRLPLAVRRDLAERVLLLSSYYKIDPALLAALVTVESAWRSRAVSPVGALGYGQLMPGTASALQVDALEPYENLDGTARFLRRMLNRYAGRDRQTRMQLALASYNAGAGAVDRWHGIPPYRETRAYVANVMRTRQTFAASVGIHISNDAGSLLAAAQQPGRRLTLRQAQGDTMAATRHRRAGRLALASTRGSTTTKTKRTHRSPYPDATDPNSVPLEAPPAMRYETSRSFVARFLGLRHRVTSPQSGSSSPAPVAANDLGPTQR